MADKFKDVFDNIQGITDDLNISGVLDKVGKYVRDRVVAKARTGKKMIDSGAEEKFPPLSKKYIRQREIRELKGDFSLDQDFFSPKRSNITLTGQYLESIKYSIDEPSGEIVVEPSGGREESDLTNKKLAGYLADMDRDIFALDNTGRKYIQNLAKREIRNLLNKKLLRK